LNLKNSVQNTSRHCRVFGGGGSSWCKGSSSFLSNLLYNKTNIKISIHLPTCKLRNFQESMGFNEMGTLKICLKFEIHERPEVGS